MRLFFLVMFLGSVSMAKTTYSVDVVSDVGKKTEVVSVFELKKLYPLNVGSKNNVCFLMKNDNVSLTLFCRAYPMPPKGPKDKNYTTISQHITCSSSKDTSLGLTDAETEKTIMLTAFCVEDKI